MLVRCDRELAYSVVRTAVAMTGKMLLKNGCYCIDESLVCPCHRVSVQFGEDERHVHKSVTLFGG